MIKSRFILGWWRSTSEVAEQAQDRFDRGFTAVKMNATEELHYIDSYQKVDEVVERVASIRERFGDAMDIGVDFHGRVHKPMAKVLAKALEPFHPMFLEEVVLPENEEHFKEVADSVAVPLATGERLYTRWQFKNLFKQGTVDIIQPDVALCGGILETRKIAAMAEAYDMAVAPSCAIWSCCTSSNSASRLMYAKRLYPRTKLRDPL